MPVRHADADAAGGAEARCGWVLEVWTTTEMPERKWRKISIDVLRGSLRK
jgi:hypothetical protein